MKISKWIVLALTVTSLLLGSCGPRTAVTPTPVSLIATPVLIKPQAPNFATETPSELGQYMIPVYYSEPYISIVNGSKDEKNLVIYSDISEYNWNSIIRIFNSHYPWVRVKIVQRGVTGVFTQYYTDVSENKPTADMIVSSDPVGWLKFFQDRRVTMYTSEENLYIPDMAKSVYGSYVVSSEPMVIIYNKKLVSAPPQNMVELASFVKNAPNEYKKQVATTDIELNTTGFAANWFWIDTKGQDGWEVLSTIGESQPVLMDTESEVIEAVGKGEVKIGYLISSGAVIPYMKNYPDLGWVYMNDSQPVMLDSMAITDKVTNVNSAKLMLDFILSQEGQYAAALGGLTPFRSDISAVTDYHLDKVFTELGDNNVHLYSFDTKLNNQATVDSFLEKWRSAVQKKIAPTPAPEPSPTK